MQAGRTQARKGNFELNRFYQSLNRIENSLGKGGSRTNSSNTNKNSRFRTAEDERQRNLANFKKELHNKGLIKGKIKLDQPYDKLKGTHNDGLDVSDDFKLLEKPSKEYEEDPYEKMKSKLLSWNSEEKQIKGSANENQYSRLTNTSNLLQQNKENIEFSLQRFETNKKEQNPVAQGLTNQLIAQLSHRNDVYCEVEKGLGEDKSHMRKKSEDLSLRMQNHFREHATMVKIIQKFKQLCGLNIADPSQLLLFLRSGDNQGEFLEGYSTRYDRPN